MFVVKKEKRKKRKEKFLKNDISFLIYNCEENL